jgi:hypothetical protein
MLYQLPNGKVIEITIEQYLRLTDDELQELLAYNMGDVVDNPFFGSALDGKYMAQEDILEEDEEIEPDLPDIDELEKLTDKDFFRDDI